MIEPIQRLRQPPRSTTLTKGNLTLYEVELNSAPPRVWRAAFLRPALSLTSPKATPKLARLEVHGTCVVFCTIPLKLHYWLRWVDRWIAYANSVVEE